MLIHLLKMFVGRYRRPLVAVILLQSLQSLATLYLPTLTADIIDIGVIGQNSGYIMSTGAVMIGVTVFQVICATGAMALTRMPRLATSRLNTRVIASTPPLADA